MTTQIINLMDWTSIKRVVRSKDGQAIDRLLSEKTFWSLPTELILKTGNLLRKNGEFEKVLWLIELLEGQKSKLDRADWIKSLFFKGDILLDRKRYKDAVACYTTLLELEENDIAYNNRALAHWELKQYKRALGDYKAAIQLNSKNATAQRGAGEMCLLLDFEEEALNYFKVAIQLNPKYAEAYTGAGIALFHMNLFDQSYGQFLAALKLNPSDQLAQEGLNRIKNVSS